jgi:alpha-beta hydrolase superfamily lysophospholipase
MAQGAQRMIPILMMLSVAAGQAVQSQEEAVRLETPGGVLHGTLVLPADPRVPMPVVLMIAGSGPTDRNGNSPLLPGANNSLKLLAEGLAGRGIASLRYDKRGVAASAGAARSEAELRFTHYSDDAAAWLAQLRRDGRFSSLIVLGHSEGSLLGIMAAQQERPDALISVAGAGRPIAEVLREQLERNLPADTKAEALRILNELQAGRTVATVPPSLLVVFRPSVQPYLLSWLPLDPAVELGRLRMPVLIVHGTTDIQVAVAEAERLARAGPARQLAILDGMNHVLKEVREASQQAASYSDPALPLHPALIERIAEFVRVINTQRGR